MFSLAFLFQQTEVLNFALTNFLPLQENSTGIGIFSWKSV